MPDHARMPALAREHQRRGVELLGAELGSRPLGRRDHQALGLTPFGVGAVELGGDLRRPLGILGEHQLDAGVGSIEAPGGVDPRSKPERECLLVDGRGIDGGRRHQGAQPGPRLAAEPPQALPHQPPVLADQGDKVGDRRQGDQVEVRIDARGLRRRSRGATRLGVAAAADGLQRQTGRSSLCSERPRIFGAGVRSAVASFWATPAAQSPSKG